MSYPRERIRFGLGAPLTPIVKYLIFINIGVFAIEYFLQLSTGGNFQSSLGLRTDFLQRFMIWQVVTYMFLHASVFHIFFNLLLLWIFGTEVEDRWGSRAFLKYYMVCGIGAGIIQVIFNTLFSGSDAIIVGASGAIYGLILAFALIDPEREITFLLALILPVRMKAKYLAMIFAGFSLFAGLAGLLADDNVAHFAHLGGMVVGYLYLKFDLPAISFGAWLAERRSSKEVVRLAQKRNKETRLRERVDEILDKINEVGYENITDEEKALLKRASKYLSEKKE